MSSMDSRPYHAGFRALMLGDRIDTSGLGRTDVLSTAPLAFRAGQHGVVLIFRYGVVVLFDLSVLEEDESGHHPWTAA
jgi:uncharacterized Rmd1/YagE family protein